MRASICAWSGLVIVLSMGSAIGSRAEHKKPATMAYLALSAEVATTSDEGYPVALRVTVKNVGNLIVTMPMLSSDCYPENGLTLESGWTSPDGKNGSGGGSGCGISDQPTLLERVRSKWIRLAPGEFMTTMLRLSAPTKKPGTIEYWVEYTPPAATSGEIEELMRVGYAIPTDKLTTEPQQFVIH